MLVLSVEEEGRPQEGRRGRGQHPVLRRREHQEEKVRRLSEINIQLNSGSKHIAIILLWFCVLLKMAFTAIVQVGNIVIVR